MKSLGRNIPRTVHDSIRKEIRTLDADWEIRASKSHFFLYVDNKKIACIGSLGNRSPDFRIHRLSLSTMKRNLQCI